MGANAHQAGEKRTGTQLKLAPQTNALTPARRPAAASGHTAHREREALTPANVLTRRGKCPIDRTRRPARKCGRSACTIPADKRAWGLVRLTPAIALWGMDPRSVPAY